MSTRTFADAASLLNDLLDRFEAKPSATRLRAKLDPQGFSSVSDLDACQVELEAVERAGGVALRRRRHGGVDHIESVRLADPSALYRHLRRTPAAERASRAVEGLDNPSLQGVLAEVQAKWARNRQALGLAPGDTVRLTLAVRLAEAMAGRAVAAGSAPTDFRTFSRAAVGDSKALERLAIAVAALVRALDQTTVAAEMISAEDVFGAFGVLRLPQPLLISGPLALDERPLDVSYVGLPHSEISRLSFTQPPAYLLTVENFTSFVRHVREVNGDHAGLVIYTGGFPSRPTLDSIKAMALLGAAPAYHWGDVDLGGLRIFAHLERSLRDVGVRLQAHLMTPDLLLAHGVKAADHVWAKAFKPDADSNVRALWEALLVEGSILELEQEAITPTRPPRLA